LRDESGVRRSNLGAKPSIFGEKFSSRGVRLSTPPGTGLTVGLVSYKSGWALLKPSTTVNNQQPTTNNYKLKSTAPYIIYKCIS
jgi:hypothetical protein